MYKIKKISLVWVSFLFLLCACGGDGGSGSHQTSSDAQSFPGVLNILTQSQNVNENLGSVNFVIERGGGTQGSVSVEWTTAQQTATNQIDYIGDNAVLSWADGEGGQRQVSIPIVDDTDPEDSEYFNFLIQNPQGGAALGNNTNITIWINDNDAQTVSKGTVTINTPSQTVNEGDVVQIQFERVDGTSGAVSVDWGTVQNTAIEDQDYGGRLETLNWADGVGGIITRSVTIIDDAQEEAAEDFRVVIQNAQGGVVIDNAASEIALTIASNDAPSGSGVIGFSSADLSVGENDETVEVTVTRSGGFDGVVSVDYATSNGSAIAGSDYTAASGTLTWADGDSADKHITLAITDDTIVESAESFIVALSNVSGATLASLSSATITINASDQASWPQDGQVHTPAARSDVVPHQRISSAFKFGVVAFTKNGIDRVDFAISGGGYTGSTLSSRAMSLNSRTGVWEYWVTIDPADFTTDGEIVVTPTAYGLDGGYRVLDPVPLVMNQSGTLAQNKVWVSKSGSDTLGKVNDSSSPYATLGKAIADIGVAGADGAIIFLDAGEWDNPYGTAPTTTTEWLTLTRYPNVAKDDVIVSYVRSSLNTKYLRFSEVKFYNANTFVIGGATGEYLWLDNLNIIGRGRTIQENSPVQGRTGWNHYVTDSYYYDTSVGTLGGALARNNTYEHILNDIHQNTLAVINTRVNDQNPEDTGIHADVYQLHTTASSNPVTASWGAGHVVDGKFENIILYGIYATQINYQGLFMRPGEATNALVKDVAIVNCFFEHRGQIAGSHGFMGKFEHVMFWHNTFVEGPWFSSEYNGVFGYDSMSFIGNDFKNFKISSSVGYETFNYGNTHNNEARYNHYMQSDNDSVPDDTPSWITYSPDTESPPTDIVDGICSLDLSDTTTYANFGMPLDGSANINKLDYIYVPVDRDGNARSTAPDIGAVEYMP